VMRKRPVKSRSDEAIPAPMTTALRLFTLFQERLASQVKTRAELGVQTPNHAKRATNQPTASRSSAWSITPVSSATTLPTVRTIRPDNPLLDTSRQKDSSLAH
jgi:hypothetical protein